MADSDVVQRRRLILRLAMEGMTIIMSILIAFLIDAWWDRQIQVARISEHYAQVSVQLSENGAQLAEAQAQALGAREAALAVVRAIAPEPVRLSRDSLTYLLDRSFRLDAADIETGAVEAVLSEGLLAASSSVELQQAFIAYRNLAEAYAREARSFEGARQKALDHLIDVGASVAIVISGSGGSASAFPLPIEDLLTDLALESRYYVLQLTSGRVLVAGRRLEERSELILSALAAGAIYKRLLLSR